MENHFTSGDSPQDSHSSNRNASAINGWHDHDVRQRTKRILLIESDHANALLIRSVLADDNGYDVRLASTPAEAFEILQLAPGEDGHAKWPVDLILFDLTSMDNQSKLSLRQIIQTHRNWPPVVILSNWSVHRIEQLLDGTGAAGVIAKPFDLEVLSDSVRRVLQKFDD